MFCWKITHTKNVVRRWVPLLKKGHKIVFATTKGLLYIYKIYNRLIQHAKQVKEFKEFCWIRMQMNLLRKLSCLIVSGNLLGHCRKVRTSGCVCLLSAGRWWARCPNRRRLGLVEQLLPVVAKSGRFFVTRCFRAILTWPTERLWLANLTLRTCVLYGIPVQDRASI